ncbi:MAG: AbgT family transporter [Bacilli bacterium]|nr:AbgT family transporter [Bacilli bacterium]
MKKKKDQIKRNINPIFVIILIAILTMIISSILSLLGLEGQKTTIVNNNLETSLITVKNIFSIEGIKFLLGGAITNFQVLEPLGLLIVSLITVSFIDFSGIIKPLVTPLKKLKPFVLTFLVLIISALFSFVGDYSYLLLMPLVALMYKELGKNPILGIITVFLGLTLAYGAGFVSDNNDYLLGILTEQAAKIDVDKNYKYHLMSNFYISISTLILVALLLTYSLEKRISPKLTKRKKDEIEEEIIEDIDPKDNKKAIIVASTIFIFFVGILIYSIIPGLPFSGILLDSESSTYFASLFSDNAPFKEGFPYIMLGIIMFITYVYRKITKNTADYSKSVSKELYGIGYILTLLFFTTQIIAIINWTNVGEVIASNLISFMSTLEFSGLPLIITLFIVTVIMGIFIPSTIGKWALMAPMIVPLFMRSNITPDFTQFIFKMADGIGKSMTPIYVYFIIMLGFIQKYNEDKKITIFGTYRLLMPTILIVAGLILLIIVCWFIIGLPLGTSTYPAL